MRAHEFITENQKRRPEISLRHLNHLNHILIADLVFLARFTGSAIPAGGFGAEFHDDFGALRAEREEVDARILDWIGNPDRASLAEPLTFTSRIDGVTRTLPTWG